MALTRNLRLDIPPLAEAGTLYAEQINAALQAIEDAAPISANARGAVADGTDSHTAISDALAAVPAGGAVVALAPGEYSCSDQLAPTVAGTWIVGVGEVATRILFDSDIAVDAVFFDTLQDTPSGLRNIEINLQSGGATPPTHAGIKASTCNGLIYDYVWTNGFRNGFEWDECGDCFADHCTGEFALFYGFLKTHSDNIHENACNGFRNGYSFAWIDKRSVTNGTFNNTTFRQYACTNRGCKADEDDSAGYYIENYVDILLDSPVVGAQTVQLGDSDIQPNIGIHIFSGGANGKRTERIQVNSPKIYHVQKIGLYCQGFGAGAGGGVVDIVNVLNPDISGTGDYAAVPAEELFGIYSDAQCTNVAIMGGAVSRSQGTAVHMAGGSIAYTKLIDFALTDSAVQGRYGLELAANTVDATQGVTAFMVDAKNNGAVRGIGYRVSSGSGHAIYFSKHQNVNLPVLDNATGIHVQQLGNSWGDEYSFGGGAPVKAILSAVSAAWNPGTVANGAIAAATQGVAGAVIGDNVLVSIKNYGNGWIIVGTVTGPGVVGWTALNMTGGPQTPGAQDVRVTVLQFA